MGRNYIWSPTRLNHGTLTFQYIFKLYFLFREHQWQLRRWQCSLCLWFRKLKSISFYSILNQHKCRYVCLRKDTVIDLLRLCGEHLKAGEPETALGIEFDIKIVENGVT